METEAAAVLPATQQPVATIQHPVEAQTVGNAFVQQYYQIQHQSPSLVYRFYQDTSQVGRPEEDGTMSITTTMQGINEKILSLEYDQCRVEIRSVDAQESFKGGVQVVVTGHLTKKSLTRCFSQVFFLAPQDTGYFVLNDIFRYIDNVNHQEGKQGLGANDEAVPVTTEQNTLPTLPVQEKHISEQSTPTEEASGSEMINPPETVDVQVVEEEVPVAEVVNEVQDETKMVVESNIKIEELPKKSYASIVMDLKGSAVAFSSPPPPRKSLPKSQEQANPVVASEAEHQLDAVDNGNNHEGEADGYSIYIKGLPMNATVALLENEFKRFGPIRNGGIQVRSNRGFCFGFVEFEVPNAVQKALEASPITIGGGRQIFVEEKKSTNTRGNNRSRFQTGRGGGFRNDGARVGRGNYGGGRGVYNRGDFNGRNDFNRGGNRGGSYNRAGDGYQRSDGDGGRMNRGGAGGMGNGAVKNMTPRVSATA